jgi:hypothetical protein
MKNTNHNSRLVKPSLMIDCSIFAASVATKGSLKFLTLQPLCTSILPTPSSHSPTVTTIPPPVLPCDSPGYASLKPKRRSGSRPASLSSASEHLPTDPAAGYEASVSDDLAIAERDRPNIRHPLPSSSTLFPGAAPSSPRNHRRPNGANPQPVSPIGPPIRTISLPPPPGAERARLPGIDKYGPLPPPPLSPSLPNFGAQDDNSLAPPARAPHHRTGSDPALEREQALRALENQIENA